MSNVKRRIAREWLIFLACVVIGMSATYLTLYFGKRVDIGYHKEYTPEEQQFIDNFNRTKTHGRPPNAFDEEAARLAEEKGRVVTDWKYKNLGDMFNDLWPILETRYSGGANRFGGDFVGDFSGTHRRSHTHRYYDWNENAVKLWLCILSPYLGFCFLRSVMWSVNTLRRH